MKKLLYLTAIAVWFTSCSVDNTQDENSIDFNNVNSRSIEANGACNKVALYNINGDIRGKAEPFVDYKSGIVMVKLTIYDSKIGTSKLYFGSVDGINSSKPGLYETGQYKLTESFIDNVYEANYMFQLSDVDSEFCFMAILDIEYESEKKETAFTVDADNVELENMYINDFVKNCFN